MQIKEVMTHDVEVVRPSAPLKEAAEKMKTLDVGALPVCDGRRLVGMLTDRDISVRAVAEGRDPLDTEVQEVMTADVVYAFEDQRVEEAAQLMSDNQIRRLPIIDRDKLLVGIVSLGDLAVSAADRSMTGAVLEEVSMPAEPKR
jgi:CBS domain-containing protein